MTNATLKIERILPGGDGLARDGEGRTVFVPRTAPGDEVEVEFTEQHASWRRARVVRLCQAAGSRVEPPCPVYDRCGGCHLQHMAYDAQLEARAEIVGDCLRRIGKVDVGKIPIEPCEQNLGYRNRLSFTLRAGGEAGALAGFHSLDPGHEIVDISRCPLAEPQVNEAWQSARASVRGAMRAGRSDARLTLRTTSDGQIGLTVESRPGGTTVTEDMAKVDHVDAIWWTDERGRVTAWAGKRLLVDRWGDYAVPVSGTSFLQVNRRASAVLEAYVLSQCRGAGARRVIDAYCGFGLRSLQIARNGASVLGIDTDRTSIRAARRLAREHDVDARFETGTVERVLPRFLPADLVVLNPPRRGTARGVTDALLRMAPQKIVYVSCNPATLARDIARISPSYSLTDCRAFDLFPQTAHVETVATLTRNDG